MFYLTPIKNTNYAYENEGSPGESLQTATNPCQTGLTMNRNQLQIQLHHVQKIDNSPVYSYM